MNTNNRKRKHRGPPGSSNRLNHHRDDEYSYSYSKTKAPAFLSHHDAYQASLTSFLTPMQAGESVHHHDFETEIATETESARQDPLQALYIQAHEADVIRGPSARIAAESLEVVEYVTELQVSNSEGGTFRSEAPVNVKTVPKIGSALIQLQLDGTLSGLSTSSSSGSLGAVSGRGTGTRTISVFDEDDDEDGGMSLPLPPAGKQITAQSGSTASMWVDRYDARLLLDALPALGARSPPPPFQATPSSPTGWSDLSSDAEDTFFFDPEETEDFRREKRRRVLERTREERLKARREEDGDEDEEKAGKEEEEDVWGGSDEEPEQTQKDLMSRTATHLLSSPNPAQLEMRILANHGRDRRFAFLRGRWGRTWGLIKAKARLGLAKEKEEKEKEKEKKAGLGVLAGYGSDSEENEGEEKGGGGVTGPNAQEEQEQTLDNNVEKTMGVEMDADAVEERAKEARRNRLKAWAEERKAARHMEEGVK